MRGTALRTLRRIRGRQLIDDSECCGECWWSAGIWNFRHGVDYRNKQSVIEAACAKVGTQGLKALKDSFASGDYL
jgi:hypothetical protein